MKAHSYPLSLGQMPGSRLMSWDWPCWPCFVVFFIGPRYEPSMQRPFPVLLGSPHQPHSGCCKQWAHVCNPEQLGAKREETEKNKKKNFVLCLSSTIHAALSATGTSSVFNIYLRVTLKPASTEKDGLPRQSERAALRGASKLPRKISNLS